MERITIKPAFQRPIVPRRKLYVMDGHAMIHQAYHAKMANLSCECPDCGGKGDLSCMSCAGTGREPTKATFVFTRSLIKLCRTHTPSYLVMAEDGPRELLERRKVYPGYKANREGGDWQLSTQMRRIKQIVKALGIPVVSSTGFEADDVIATLVDCGRDVTGLEVVIVGRDKDLTQLIGPSVRLYDPIAEEFLDGRWVQKRWGVFNYQMIDYLAMVGDSGDNIKGVPGLGEKGAVEILTKHVSAARFKASLVKRAIDGVGEEFTKAEKTLMAGWREFEFCRKLIELNGDCDLRGITGFDDLRFKELTLRKAAPIFRRLGFRRWSDEDKT